MKTNALVRSIDFATRYGSEEFLIVLPNTDGAGARQVAEKLLLAVLEAQIRCDTSSIVPCITISIGIYSGVPYSENQCWDMVEKADKALYQAKQKGGNRIEVEA